MMTSDGNDTNPRSRQTWVCGRQPATWMLTTIIDHKDIRHWPIERVTFQQVRLAYPRLAPYHQRPPAPGAQILD
jgi:hypothetical protein